MEPKLTMKKIWDNLTDPEKPLEKLRNIQSIISFGVIDIATRDEHLAKRILEIAEINQCLE